MPNDFPMYLVFVCTFLFAAIALVSLGRVKQAAAPENEITRRRHEVERVMNDPALRAPGRR